MSAATRMHQARFEIETAGRGLVGIDERVRAIVAGSGISDGLATVFVHHTSASLLLGENADPQVCADLERFLARLVPDGDAIFRHDAEGPDDMPAHVRSVLTGASIGMPVRGGRLDLGTWQGVFLYEHRTAPHRRRVSVTVLGTQ